MKRTLIFAAAACACSPAMGAVPEPDATAVAKSSDDDAPDYRVGPWNIYRDETNKVCRAVLISTTEDRGLTIDYNAKNGGVLLGAYNQDATSMASGDKVTLNVVFLTGNRTDTGWGQAEFTTYVGDDGKRLFGSPRFNKHMLEDIAKQEIIGLTYQGRVVVSAKLDDSAAMVSKLKECSLKIAGLNPADPFIP